MEELQFLYNEEFNEAIGINKVEYYVSQTKDRALIKKQIKKKEQNKDVKSLINDLASIISYLKNLISKLDSVENSRTIISAMKEIRLTINDISSIKEELRNTQEENISKFYVPLSELREWIKNNS